jgi:hypothetical protein
LHPAFRIDEGAGSLGPRGNRQQHIGVVQRPALVGRHHDDEVGTLDGLHGSDWIMGIEFGLDAEQQVGAQRLGQHLLGIQPLIAGEPSAP